MSVDFNQNVAKHDEYESKEITLSISERAKGQHDAGDNNERVHVLLAALFCASSDPAVSGPVLSNGEHVVQHLPMAGLRQ